MEDNNVYIGSRVFGTIQYEDDDMPWMYGNFQPAEHFEDLIHYLAPCEDEPGQEWIDFSSLAADEIRPDEVRWGSDGNNIIYFEFFSIESNHGVFETRVWGYDCSPQLNSCVNWN